MRTPTTTNLENLDATLLAPQTGEVTRFRATLPVSGVAQAGHEDIPPTRTALGV